MFNRVKKDEDITLVKENPKFLQNFFLGEKNLMPFWVADMDFSLAPEIKMALAKRVDKSIFAYEMNGSEVKKSVADWFKRRHNWIMEKGTIRTSSGVITSIGIFIQLLTKEGDGIVFQTPGFQQFSQVIKKNNRKVVKNPLKLVDGKYEIDFEDLELKMKESKLLILCSPHNPTGRVWTKEELLKIGELAHKHNIFVIADEIHSDIIFSNKKFIPYGSLNTQFVQNSVSLFSPAKTFNIPSISDSFVYIKNKQIQEQYDEFMSKLSLGNTSVLNAVAMKTAYNEGEEWLDELLVYLKDNIDYIADYLEIHIPKVKVIYPEGTYLVWLDFRELELDAKELEKFLIDAGLALSPGHWYGKEGAGFARMTVATSKAFIKEALDELKEAINSLK